MGNVLLITIDTLRADHLGCFGYRVIQTPNIDSLARQGVLFQQTFTPVPITLPSHASIFTGLYPYQHGVLDNGSFSLKKEAITLAEILKNSGYKTAAFVGAFVLDSIFGLDQGFDDYDDYMPKQDDHTAKQDKVMAIHFAERPASQVTERAISWLRKQQVAKAAPCPFFLWLHYFEPHAPYEPPEPFKSRYSHSAYDGEIAAVDHWLGILVQELKRLGLFDKILIVVTADHGEGLGEHQESTHGNFLYDSTLRVPLIFKLPQSRFFGLIPKRINSLTRTIDVMPTILDLLGLSAHIPQGIDGQSLLPLIQEERAWSRGATGSEGGKDFEDVKGFEDLRGKDLKGDKGRGDKRDRRGDKRDKRNDSDKGDDGAGRRYLLCETYYPFFHYGWSPEFGLRTEEWKYIEAPKPELYYLKDDPGERVNLYEPKHPVVSELRLRMERGRVERDRDFRKISPSASSAPPKLTQLMREQLASLGYLQVNSLSSFGKLARLPDVKDRVAVLQGIDEAVSAISQGRYQEALGKLTSILRSDSENISALLYQACLYRKLGQYPLAIAAFRKILAIDPTHIDIHNHLGTIYHEMHDPNQAIREFLQEIKLHPNHVEAHYNLALEYADQGKIKKALESVLSVLRLDQTYAEGYNLRGKLRIREGNIVGAEEDFQKAIALFPECADAHNNLGVLYGQQGKLAQAIRELTVAKSFDPQNAAILVNLANVCLQQNQFSLAEEHLQQALVLQPASIEAKEALGRVFLQAGRTEKARELLEQVVKTCPHRAKSRLLLGQVYTIQGLGPNARKELEEAIRLDPQDEQAYVKLANLLFQQGDVSAALSRWEKAISLNPKNLEAYHNLGVALYQQGKMSEAVKSWESALRLDPNSAAVRLHLGSARFQQGKIQAAISEWKKVLAIEPGNFEALSNLGSAYIRQGDVEEAKRYWQKAVEIRPQSADLHFNLAILFLQQGMMAEGESELIKVLKINPHYPKAPELLERARAGRRARGGTWQ